MSAESQKKVSPKENRLAQSMLLGLSCGIAVVFAVIFFVNLVGQFRLSDLNYDPNHWWIAFPPSASFPRVLQIVEQVFALYVVVIFVAYAVSPPVARWRRRATRAAVELLWLLVAWNVLEFYGALAVGKVHTPFPIPFALLAGAALIPIWIGAGAERAKRSAIVWMTAIVGAVCAAFLLPLLQMVCFGLMDHRAQAKQDVPEARIAIVFCTDPVSGGDPQGVAQRMATAIDLTLHHGIVEVCVSGHLSPEQVTQARALFEKAGIPKGKLEFDGKARTPEQAISDVLSAFPQKDLVIVPVSDYREMARIDMLVAQEGRFALPSPVIDSRASTGQILGEVPRLWKCYFEAASR